MPRNDPPKKREKIKEIFLDAYRTHGSITKAAEIAGTCRKTPQRWREADPHFAEEMEKALDGYIDELESEADRRAKYGVPEPVFFQGHECGTVMRYSDTLLIFRLKALRPEKYRERSHVALSTHEEALEKLK